MKTLNTDKAPDAVGPYSQAVAVDSWVFTAGQVGLDPETMELVPGGFEPQTVQVLKNLRAVLGAAGCTPQDIVKTTIYLSDMADFATVNRLYADFVQDHRPARSTVQAAGLPKGALVEIDVVARRA
jgi:2-iminobutanoate/2-iminopropanoate deaminase